MNNNSGDSAKRTTSIRLDPTLWHKAKVKALENRQNIGEYIEGLIKKDLKK